jgi:ABC-2 type transport system permease protein
MPAAVQEMFGMSALVDGYLAFLAVFSGYLTAAYVVFAVQTLRTEEGRGRAEAVLATATSRRAWAGSHLLVVAAGAALIMVVTGVGTGVAAAAVTGTWEMVGQVTLAHLNLLPAVLAVLGLCALLYGWAPRLLAPVGWALVAIMVLVGNFAALLDLPAWVRDLSPLSHPAQVPVEEAQALPLVALSGLALAGVAVGLLGLARRQVGVR